MIQTEIFTQGKIGLLNFLNSYNFLLHLSDAELRKRYFKIFKTANIMFIVSLISSLFLPFSLVQFIHQTVTSIIFSFDYPKLIKTYETKQKQYTKNNGIILSILMLIYQFNLAILILIIGRYTRLVFFLELFYYIFYLIVPGLHILGFSIRERITLMETQWAYYIGFTIIPFWLFSNSLIGLYISDLLIPIMMCSINHHTTLPPIFNLRLGMFNTLMNFSTKMFLSLLTFDQKKYTQEIVE